MADSDALTDALTQSSLESPSSPDISPAGEGTNAHEEHVTIALSAQDNIQSLQPLLTEMYMLRQDFDTKVKYDESKERLIESLHRELQVYRDGLHFRVLRPVFTDLISLHDDIGKVLDTLSDSAESVQRLRMFQETVEEILHRQGVELFTLAEELFLPSKQRNQRVIPTSDIAQDRHIARRIRKGFEYEGKLLRPEIVETYKYVAAANQ